MRVRRDVGCVNVTDRMPFHWYRNREWKMRQHGANGAEPNICLSQFRLCGVSIWMFMLCISIVWLLNYVVYFKYWMTGKFKDITFIVHLQNVAPRLIMRWSIGSLICDSMFPMGVLFGLSRTTLGITKTECTLPRPNECTVMINSRLHCCIHHYLN